MVTGPVWTGAPATVPFGFRPPGTLLTPGVLVAVGVLPTAGLVEVIGAPALLVPSGATAGLTAMALLTPALTASCWFGVMVPGAGASEADGAAEPAPVDRRLP